MNTSALVEWQRVDPENGLVEPWLTWDFMEWVKKMDLSDKTILELGAGRSTAWWRKKAKWVDSIEANPEWAIQAMKDCQDNNLTNGEMFFAEIPDGMADQYLEKYTSLIPKEKRYDIIIIDGIYRTEMIAWGIKHLQANNGGYLFIDNLDQDFVWISPQAMEMVKWYKGETFIQMEHTNHEGKPWNTRYYYIPELPF